MGRNYPIRESEGLVSSSIMLTHAALDTIMLDYHRPHFRTETIILSREEALKLAATINKIFVLDAMSEV